jgi:hypothetical protein
MVLRRGARARRAVGATVPRSSPTPGMGWQHLDAAVSGDEPSRRASGTRPPTTARGSAGSVSAARTRAARSAMSGSGYGATCGFQRVPRHVPGAPHGDAWPTTPRARSRRDVRRDRDRGMDGATWTKRAPPRALPPAPRSRSPTTRRGSAPCCSALAHAPAVGHVEYDAPRGRGACPRRRRPRGSSTAWSMTPHASGSSSSGARGGPASRWARRTRGHVGVGRHRLSSRDLVPLPRTHTALAYDTARRQLVMFGGWDPRLAVTPCDTWDGDGRTWTRRCQPRARRRGAYTRSPTRVAPAHGAVRRVHGPGGPHPADTWNGTAGLVTDAAAGEPTGPQLGGDVLRRGAAARRAVRRRAARNGTGRHLGMGRRGWSRGRRP